MKQKFLRSRFVKVTTERECFTAIVNGTYSQLYRGNDVDNYSIWEVRGDKVVNCRSWFRENQLELLPEEYQDQRRAEEMIERYNLK